MRNKLLSFVAMALVAIGINAQTWTAPEPPTAETPGSDPISGHLYQVKNTEAAMFLAGGASWYGWATSTVLVDPTLEEPLTFTLTETENGWTFARTTDGKFTFISGSYEGKGEMHVDMASQGHQYFELIKQDNGKYHIRAVASDTNYGSSMEDYEEKCWGWEGFESDFPTAVYATVVPGESTFCDWEFVDFSVYNAQLELYNLTATADTEDLGVDYSPYEAAYNSGDLEQLQAAIAELKTLIATARAYAVFRYGEDGVNSPSSTNPADGTSLIQNNDFSLGNISGWTCTFISGQNATNVGYQGAGYTNGDVQISQFIEAWAAGGTNFNPEISFRAIGDGELCQTMPNLPAGLYKFTADCIAVQQDGASSPVTGVQLFAIGGEIDRYIEIATGDGLPEHFEVTFVSTGGDVTMGLRTRNATANWIAADNFTLTYYGEVEDDPNKVILDQRIAELEAQYPDLDNVMANNDVKEAYEAAMNNAKGAFEDYEAILASLNDAASALATSVSEYNAFGLKIEKLQETIDQLTSQWPDIEGEISDWWDGVVGGYEDCTYTSEDMAKVDTDLQAIIADYISNNAKVGDNLTVLLTNPSFDTGNTNGWTSTGASPATAAYDAQGANTTGTMTAEYLEEVGESDPSTWGRNCEIYHAAFDLSQTIKNMPAGMYEFTCQGFWRGKNENGNDTDDTPGQLYAIINGEEQTDDLANINDYASADQLYACGAWGDDIQANNGSGWVPFCMSGAMYHFHHKNDGEHYDYTSKLNIILTEPADITVGVRTTSGGTWVIFDNFQIVYQGKNGYGLYISELMEKAEAEEENGILTKEAKDKLEAAIMAGDEAANNDGTEEECIAAIEQLRSAITFAQNTKKLAESLSNLCFDLNDRSRDITSSDDTFLELLNTTADNLNDPEYEYATNAELEQLYTDLQKGFTKFVQADFLDATEGNPGDISAAIYNGTFTDINEEGTNVGWTINGGLGLGEGAAEFFNQTFEFSQVIYGLAPGYYRLYVNGYYRCGLPADVEKMLNEGEAEAKNVTLFAGETTTPLLLISSDFEKYNEVNPAGAEVTINEVTGFLPNNMAQAATAFEKELYQNCLQFEVAEGQESVTIGLKKDVAVTNDWTMFDTWRLEYLGTSTPTEDPTTAIEGVEGETERQFVIFNLAGQRVSKATKGIYIINGKKMLVK